MAPGKLLPGEVIAGQFCMELPGEDQQVTVCTYTDWIRREVRTLVQKWQVRSDPVGFYSISIHVVH